MTNQVVEFAAFHLLSNKTEAELLEASDQFQKAFLDGRKGFVRRTLVKHADGAYADIVVWADDSSCKEAVAAAGQDEAAQPYFSLLDHAREHQPRKAGAMEFFKVVGTYG